MKLTKLHLYNFRNYSELDFFPNENLNIILGKNAMGKTNLLESIYLLTTGKSFKIIKNNEMIKLNEDKSIINGEIQYKNYKDELKVSINKLNKNNYSINSEEFNLKNYKKNFSSIIFTPEDLNLIKQGPMIRRKYLDVLISQIDPIYEFNFSKYKNVLFQRNKLLKLNDDSSLLNIYDFELAELGVKILLKRLKYIKELENYTKEDFFKLSGKNFKITYLSSIPINLKEKDMINVFREFLEKNRKRDLQFKYTTIGPHIDDLNFKINDLNAKYYASQGEIRSIILSLKLGEIKLVLNKKNYKPILLLDDVFSELDETRSEYLINNLKNIQTFITSTHLNENILKFLKGEFFNVENGKIIRKLED